MIRQSAYFVLFLLAFLSFPNEATLQTNKKAASSVYKPPQDTCQEQINKLTRGFETKLGDLKNQLGVAQGQANTYKAQLTTAQTERDKYKTLADSLQQENAGLQVKLNISEKRNSTLSDEIEGLSGEKAKLSRDNDAFRSRIGDLEPENARLTTLNTALNARVTELDKLNKGLEDDVKTLRASRQTVPAPIGTPSGELSDTRAQLLAKDQEIAQSKAAYQGLAAQCYKDPSQILSNDDIAKRNGDTSNEYHTIYENGQRYLARDLLVGTLILPDPSSLNFEAGKQGIIEVKFRPRELGDLQTKWFVDFSFTKGLIDFPYQQPQPDKGLRREITPGVDETWVWKTNSVSPSGFAKDVARIIMDAGYVTEGGEKRITVEDKNLLIGEVVMPGVWAEVWDWLKANSLALVGLLSGILALATGYLAYAKGRVEREKSELELLLLQFKAASPGTGD